MGDVLGFPHGFRGTDNGPVDPPCETVGMPPAEGYRLQHVVLPEPPAECSNPFPWINVINCASGGCHARIQIDRESFIDIPISDAKAADLIMRLSDHLQRSLRR